MGKMILISKSYFVDKTRQAFIIPKNGLGLWATKPKT
jgi:hypothetical protein